MKIKIARKLLNQQDMKPKKTVRIMGHFPWIEVNRKQDNCRSLSTPMVGVERQ